MTASSSRATDRASLLEHLMAVVRPEFRVDVLVPAPTDPVLGVPDCAVPGCDYPVADHGICNGHRLRWRDLGRPPLTEFLTNPGPPLRGRSRLGRCTVTGCRYGTAGKGLCSKHRGRWERDGHPDPIAWASTAAPVADPAEQTTCRLSYCDLWAEFGSPLCRSHQARWRHSAVRDLDEFVADCERLGKAFIDFRGLSPQLRLELQYAVQSRVDAATTRISTAAVTIAIRYLLAAGVSSLLDRRREHWRGVAGKRRDVGKYRRAAAFLVFARDTVDALGEKTGWDTEYPRDIWRLSRLPGLVLTAGEQRPHAQLRFDRITQPWLRELGKRWIRLRLSGGRNVETVVGNLNALTRFSELLATTTTTTTDITSLADIDRAMLERFLAWLATQPIAAVTRSAQIGGLQLFFEAIRRHRWNDQYQPPQYFSPTTTRSGHPTRLGESPNTS